MVYDLICYDRIEYYNVCFGEYTMLTHFKKKLWLAQTDRFSYCAHIPLAGCKLLLTVCALHALHRGGTRIRCDALYTSPLLVLAPPASLLKEIKKTHKTTATNDNRSTIILTGVFAVHMVVPRCVAVNIPLRVLIYLAIFASPWFKNSLHSIRDPEILSLRCFGFGDIVFKRVVF